MDTINKQNKEYDLLILEDDETDWLELKRVLNNYQITFYPNETSEFRKIQHELALYTKSKSLYNPTERYKQLFSNINVHYIFLDVRWKSSRSPSVMDTSGIQFKSQVLDEIFPSAIYYYLSKYGYDELQLAEINTENEFFISKESLDNEIDTKFMIKHSFNRQHSDTDPKPAETNRPETTYSFNRSREKLKKKKLNLVNYMINGFFLTSIALLSLYSLISLIMTLYEDYVNKNYNLIPITEKCFLLSLPIFVLLSFYSIYKLSFQQFLTKEDYYFVPEDVDKLATTINFIKKIFIANLISYLFVSIVEILQISGKNSQNTDQSINTSKFYFSCLILVVVIVYYFLIEKHRFKTKSN